jgi:1-phosphofructokinase family hexose kinase
MLVTVTLNPSLDRTLSVPRLQPGAIHRARLLRQDLGGKGINVSRALRALGIESRLTGFLGGATGQALHSGLAAEGFDAAFVDVDDETRQNVTLLDESEGVYTKINEPGAAVRPEHIAALKEQILAQARPGDLWAFCGSQPPGAPPGLYGELVGLVQGRGARAFLDTSGPPLRAGVRAGPFAIKPNSDEAAEVLGYPVDGEAGHIRAARDLRALGVRLVCLTRGAQGLVLALDDEIVIAELPPVAARSPVGAGDASLAGLLWAVAEGCDVRETARRAVACGTAAAMQEGTGVGDRALVEQLLPAVTVRQVGASSR